MNLPWTGPTETEEEFNARMSELQDDLRQLMQKTPEEVAGDPRESVYYGFMLSALLKDGRNEDARQLADWMVRRFPLEGLTRLALSTAYSQLGDLSEALAQLGVLIALEPDFFA